MTEYERGLRDAAQICREQARACLPFRSFSFSWWRKKPQKHINLNMRERARMAIRCAQAIENKRDS